MEEKEASKVVALLPSTAASEILDLEDERKLGPSSQGASSEERQGGVDPIVDSRTTPPLDEKEILRALELLERDSVAFAQSFTSLFASLRLALSEVTNSSVDHMECFNDAAGRLQECALDAATKGNRYINSCLRLNEEMRNIDSLASQIKLLRRNVDTLDLAVNKLLRLP